MVTRGERAFRKTVVNGRVNNIKMDLKEVGSDVRNWMDLSQDRDQWRSYVRAVMNYRAP